MESTMPVRVLLIAELCNPEWPSVPLVSWHYFRALQRYSEIHLVTHERSREALKRQGVSSDEVTFINSDNLLRPLRHLTALLGRRDGKGWTLGTAANLISYRYFEKLTHAHFREQLRSGRFDLVHRLTPLSPMASSPMAGQWGVPFVVGPLNGGLPWPKQFRKAQKDEREWLGHARWIARYLPHFRSTYRHAKAVISGSVDAWQQIASLAGDRHVYLPRNGVDTAAFLFQPRPGVTDPSRPLRVLFIGRLVPLKGVDMLLEAAEHLLKRRQMQVVIAGDGPHRPVIEQMIGEREMPGVSLLGTVPHTQLPSLLAESDLFAMPSIKDFGGAVVLEAMACGVPPVVVDYGGPGELATNSTGVLVPMGPRAQIVAGLRSALERLEKDRQAVAAKSLAARKRAEDWFDWDIKARQLVEVYRWALRQRNRPDWGMPLHDGSGSQAYSFAASAQ